MPAPRSGRRRGRTCLSYTIRGGKSPGKRAPVAGRPVQNLRKAERRRFGPVRNRRRREVGRRYFAASSLSISSMTEFISFIAASNGAEVVMSTPASLSRSIGYLEEPERSRFR